ncbi:MAG TPA: S53 family peptidase [Candidatus Nitrosotalea sp.]|nr:S53 family peptidase [Candidatus Nitrosotalea sp.]
MSSPTQKIPLLGSERSLLSGSSLVGSPEPNERIQVTILVRRMLSMEIAYRVEQNSSQLPSNRRHITREEFRSKYGYFSEDLAKVEEFAHKHNLEVVKKNELHCTVVLSGTVDSFCTAFDIKLALYKHPEGTYRGRTGPVHIPQELSQIVQGVFGLDNRPQTRPHFRRLQEKGPGKSLPSHVSYEPNKLANLYDFPKGLDGTGQSIAIIELGGGYRTTDLQTYFENLGIGMPKVLTVSVDGANNSPTGSPDGPDGEVMLDIEIAGSIAPQANIVVYFAPNTDIGFLDAINTAIHDTVNKPSVISISWGSDESSWTTQAQNAFNQVFQNASALGITVCAAAGDNGSSDGVNDGRAHVDFPASSPYVLGCGGTRLTSSNDKIVNEIVWNDLPFGGATGGGISDVFDPPTWQSGANVPPSSNPDGHRGRGVPDVSGDADPVTGYDVLVDGKNTVIGGTSAVAPLYAGLVAIINQGLGHPVGYLNPLLYTKMPSSIFVDITNGNNGSYKAGKGWDACTGLGRADGTKLLDALKAN